MLEDYNIVHFTIRKDSSKIQKHVYRSGTVNSNTVNSKFHLIQSYCDYLARILSFHV